MHSRHAGTIAALLITAALFLAMPGLLKKTLREDSNRMAHSLRPAKMRTLTVWLLPGAGEDRQAISRACAEFEKQNRGARVFLRRVTASELHGRDAVLPDVVLFVTGEINRPQDVLVPLAPPSPHPSAQHAGTAYAVPLWYREEFLCYPQSWGEDPWQELTQPGRLQLPSGTALQRLLMTCPENLRTALADAALGRAQLPPQPLEKKDGLPPPVGPTPTPGAQGQARVGFAAQEGERTLTLTPETSSLVRYAALCRSGEDARAFVELLSGRVEEGLIPVGAETVLPNAFEHTREEMDEICMDGFSRLADPVLTLMRLR